MLAPACRRNGRADHGPRPGARRGPRPARRGERRDAQEDADEGDALHAHHEVRPGGEAARQSDGVEGPEVEPAGDHLGARGGRQRGPDRLGVGQRGLHEERRPVGQPAQRIALLEGVEPMQRHEVDGRQLGVLADRLIGDGQVVGRRQALLLGPVSRVGLDVAGRRARRPRWRRALLVVTDPKPPMEWPRRCTRPAGRRSTAGAVSANG